MNRECLSSGSLFILEIFSENEDNNLYPKYYYSYKLPKGKNNFIKLK